MGGAIRKKIIQQNEQDLFQVSEKFKQFIYFFKYKLSLSGVWIPTRSREIYTTFDSQPQKQKLAQQISKTLHRSKQPLQTRDRYEPEMNRSVSGTSHFYLGFWHSNSQGDLKWAWTEQKLDHW